MPYPHTLSAYQGDHFYQYAESSESSKISSVQLLTSLARDQTGKLSSSEIAAMRDYAGASHRQLNDYLIKHLSGQSIEPETGEKYNQIAKQLNSAIYNSKLPESITVYRGLQNKGDVVLFPLSEWLGFSSTTTQFLTAAHFATGCSGNLWKGGAGGVILEIKLEKGTPALAVVGGATEHELLLPAGIKYKVIEEDAPRNPDDKRRVYKCEIVIPSKLLL